MGIDFLNNNKKIMKVLCRGRQSFLHAISVPDIVFISSKPTKVYGFYFNSWYFLVSRCLLQIQPLSSL